MWSPRVPCLRGGCSPTTGAPRARPPPPHYRGPLHRPRRPHPGRRPRSAGSPPRDACGPAARCLGCSLHQKSMQGAPGGSATAPPQRPGTHETIRKSHPRHPTDSPHERGVRPYRRTHPTARWAYATRPFVGARECVGRSGRRMPGSAAGIGPGRRPWDPSSRLVPKKDSGYVRSPPQTAQRRRGRRSGRPGPPLKIWDEIRARVTVSAIRTPRRAAPAGSGRAAPRDAAPTALTVAVTPVPRPERAGAAGPGCARGKEARARRAGAQFGEILQLTENPAAAGPHA